MPGFPEAGMPARTQGLAPSHEFYTLSAWLAPATPEAATAA